MYSNNRTTHIQISQHICAAYAHVQHICYFSLPPPPPHKKKVFCCPHLSPPPCPGAFKGVTLSPPPLTVYHSPPPLLDCPLIGKLLARVCVCVRERETERATLPMHLNSLLSRCCMNYFFRLFLDIS